MLDGEELGRAIRSDHELDGTELVMVTAKGRVGDGARVRAVHVRDPESGEERREEGDYFFSTMPVQELVRALDAPVPEHVRAIAEGLVRGLRGGAR